jgi:hypothetical protein
MAPLGWLLLALLFISMTRKRGVYIFPLLPALALAAPCLPAIYAARAVQWIGVALAACWCSPAARPRWRSCSACRRRCGRRRGRTAFAHPFLLLALAALMLRAQPVAPAAAPLASGARRRGAGVRLR